MAVSTIWYDYRSGCYVCTTEVQLTADVAAYAGTAGNGSGLSAGVSCVCLANGALYFWNGEAFVKFGV